MSSKEKNPRLRAKRHSAAHILAEAVTDLIPEAKLGIGPPTDDGFYYDFDLPESLGEDDLAEIEARMRRSIDADHDFVMREVSPEEAMRLFEEQPYKLELIEALLAGEMDPHGHATSEEVRLTVYEHDSFVDLCNGPHAESTGHPTPSSTWPRSSTPPPTDP